MRVLDGMRYYKKTKEQNNMVRVRVRMKDSVDPLCLQYAAEKAFERCRLFRMIIVRDEKWFCLQESERVPIIHKDDGQRHTAGTEDNNGHMLWIGYCDRTIDVDFFHGITDGKGIMMFVQVLLSFYIEKKYAESIGAMGIPEDPMEYTEPIRVLKQEPVKSGNGYEYEKAFQLEQEQMAEESECQYYELRLDAKAFEEFMSHENTSTASVFALFMNRVIAAERRKGDQPVVAAMAVNARRAYKAEKTMQCCVATIPIWYDDQVAEMSLSEQLTFTKKMIRDGVQPENILAGALKTVKFNEKLDEMCATLEEKHQYCCQIARKGLDRYTYGISYVGDMAMGESIDEYAEEVRVMLCANTSPVILEITKYKEHFLISYCTHLIQDPYVYKLQEAFHRAGIPCTCEKQENYLETLAVF